MSDLNRIDEHSDERAYFAARAEAERRRAADATDPRARAAHQWLASEYAERAKTGAAND
ncbi:hypothetical protein [Sphingomonas sp. LHG3406-1]|uniref:hypothetical protein n=1 Tax=Sphingomonas sp. LHG3406-1 TaxID=2804617 RepID=UPI0026333AA9|nr:hypothetical protein [Sphingomonas sp. LHG3406-1]